MNLEYEKTKQLSILRKNHLREDKMMFLLLVFVISVKFEQREKRTRFFQTFLQGLVGLDELYKTVPLQNFFCSKNCEKNLAFFCFFVFHIQRLFL